MSSGKRKPTAPRELPVLLSTYAFPGNVRELKAMTYDAVSLHRERTLSMETFVKAIDRGGGALPERSASAPGENPFLLVEPLPSIHDAVELLVEEALARASGNQTIAARMLGITQSALSKRQKAARGTGLTRRSKGYEPAHVGEQAWSWRSHPVADHCTSGGRGASRVRILISLRRRGWNRRLTIARRYALATVWHPTCSAQGPEAG